MSLSEYNFTKPFFHFEGIWNHLPRILDRLALLVSSDCFFVYSLIDKFMPRPEWKY